MDDSAVAATAETAGSPADGTTGERGEDPSVPHPSIRIEGWGTRTRFRKWCRSSAQAIRVRRTAVDAVLILAIGLTAQMGRFSWQGGRFMVNADSVQYVDGAEALLDPEQTPNFGFRKPGYALVLAAVAVLFGNMGYAAVAVNHFCYGLLPAAAYGLGCNLHSRWTGWVAAILTIARLQALFWADRIMSEPVYTCLLTFGLLVLACWLSRQRKARWLVFAGLLLGGAWLVRAAAVAVIVAAVAVLVFLWHRLPAGETTGWKPVPHIENRCQRPRRILAACACLLAPIGAAVLFECELNRRWGGHFRTCTGGLGPMLLMRARYLQGVEFPDTTAARACAALLPERDPGDAYCVNKLDTWVAHHRAVQTRSMDEWTFDALARRAALEMFAADPVKYLSTSGKIIFRHALRRRNDPMLARYAWPGHAPMLLPGDAPDNAQSREQWYTYWALPHRSRAQSQALVARMHAVATQQAPFALAGPLTSIRHLTLLPAATAVVGVLIRVGAVWPGFALIGCGLLGLNRRTCLLLGLVYLADCVLIGMCGATDEANRRFQEVWIAIDTTLAAALVTGLLATAAKSIRCRFRPPPSEGV